MSTETAPPPPPPAAPAASATEDRTVAILAYITLLGFIIAIVMHGSKKTQIGTFHLRQALGLFVTAFAGGLILAIIPIIGWALIPFFMLGIGILAIIGIIAAAGGQQKPLPILGEKYQKWFANAFT
jgi:uncharacterized membrane protein